MISVFYFSKKNLFIFVFKNSRPRYDPRVHYYATYRTCNYYHRINLFRCLFPPCFFRLACPFSCFLFSVVKVDSAKVLLGFFFFFFFVFRFSVGQVFKSLRASGFLDGLQLVSVTCLDCNSIHLFCTQSCSSKFVFIFSERQTSCWCQKDN